MPTNPRNSTLPRGATRRKCLGAWLRARLCIGTQNGRGVLENLAAVVLEIDWLPDMDLNHDKQIQSLLCYRYTIGQ